MLVYTQGFVNCPEGGGGGSDKVEGAHEKEKRGPESWGPVVNDKSAGRGAILEGG